MTHRHDFALIALLGLSAQALACTSPNNLVSNCGFSANINGWENETSGSCVPNSTIGVTDAGNIQCTGFLGGFGYVVRFRQCIKTASGVTGNKLYAYGGWAQVVSGTGVTCTVEAADFTQDNCQFNINAATTPLAPGGGYVKSTPATYTTGPGTLSAHVRVECKSNTAFQIRADDMFFINERIFANGFDP